MSTRGAKPAQNPHQTSIKPTKPMIPYQYGYCLLIGTFDDSR